MWRFHFPIGILGQVWCLIVSIPDLCPLSYFLYDNMHRGYKTFFMLNSGEHEIFPAHKC